MILATKPMHNSQHELLFPDAKTQL